MTESCRVFGDKLSQAEFVHRETIKLAVTLLIVTAVILHQLELNKDREKSLSSLIAKHADIHHKKFTTFPLDIPITLIWIDFLRKSL